MPGDGDTLTTTVLTDETTYSVKPDRAEPVRKFTWRELSKLNQPHNAHVAVRGKVDLRFNNGVDP